LGFERSRARGGLGADRAGAPGDVHGYGVETRNAASGRVFVARLDTCAGSC